MSKAPKSRTELLSGGDSDKAHAQYQVQSQEDADDADDTWADRPSTGDRSQGIATAGIGSDGVELTSMLHEIGAHAVPSNHKRLSVLEEEGGARDVRHGFHEKDYKTKLFALLFFLASKIVFPFVDFFTDVSMIITFAIPIMVGVEVCLDYRESTSSYNFVDSPEWSIDGGLCGPIDNRVTVESSQGSGRMEAPERRRTRKLTSGDEKELYVREGQSSYVRKQRRLQKQKDRLAKERAEFAAVAAGLRENFTVATNKRDPDTSAISNRAKQQSVGAGKGAAARAIATRSTRDKKSKHMTLRRLKEINAERDEKLLNPYVERLNKEKQLLAEAELRANPVPVAKLTISTATTTATTAANSENYENVKMTAAEKRASLPEGTVEQFATVDGKKKMALDMTREEKISVMKKIRTEKEQSVDHRKLSTVDPTTVSDNCDGLSTQAACEAIDQCRWGTVPGATTSSCFDPVLRYFTGVSADEYAFNVKDFYGFYCSEFVPYHRGEEAGSAPLSANICQTWNPSKIDGTSTTQLCDWDFAYGYCAVKQSFLWYNQPDDCQRVSSFGSTSTTSSTCDNMLNCEWTEYDEDNSYYRCTDVLMLEYLDYPTLISTHESMYSPSGYCEVLDTENVGSCCTSSTTRTGADNSAFPSTVSVYDIAPTTACCTNNGADTCTKESSGSSSASVICYQENDYMLDTLNVGTATDGQVDYICGPNQKCLPAQISATYSDTGASARLCEQCESCAQILYENQYQPADGGSAGSTDQDIADYYTEVFESGFSCCSCAVIAGGETCITTANDAGLASSNTFYSSCTTINSLPDQILGDIAISEYDTEGEYRISSQPYAMRAGHVYSQSLSCRGEKLDSEDEVCLGIFFEGGEEEYFKTSGDEECTYRTENAIRYIGTNQESCMSRYVTSPDTYMTSVGLSQCHKKDNWGDYNCLGFSDIFDFWLASDTEDYSYMENYAYPSCGITYDQQSQSYDYSDSGTQNYTQYADCCAMDTSGNRFGGRDAASSSSLGTYERCDIFDPNSNGNTCPCGCRRYRDGGDKWGSGNPYACYDPLLEAHRDTNNETWVDVSDYCYYLTNSACCSGANAWKDYTEDSSDWTGGNPTSLCEWDSSRIGGTEPGLARCQPIPNLYPAGSACKTSKECSCVKPNTGVNIFKEANGYSNDAQCPHKKLCYLAPEDECELIKYPQPWFQLMAGKTYGEIDDEWDDSGPNWYIWAYPYVQRWRQGSTICEDVGGYNSTLSSSEQDAYLQFSSVDSFVECDGYLMSFGCQSKSDLTTIGDWIISPLGLYMVCGGLEDDTCRHCDLLGLFNRNADTMYVYGDVQLDSVMTARHFAIFQTIFTILLVLVVIAKEALGLIILSMMIYKNKTRKDKYGIDDQAGHAFNHDYDYVTIGKDSIVGLIFLMMVSMDIYCKEGLPGLSVYVIRFKELEEGWTSQGLFERYVHAHDENAKFETHDYDHSNDVHVERGQIKDPHGNKRMHGRTADLHPSIVAHYSDKKVKKHHNEHHDDEGDFFIPPLIDPETKLMWIWTIFETLEAISGLALGATILLRLAIASSSAMVPATNEVSTASLAFVSSFGGLMFNVVRKCCHPHGWLKTFRDAMLCAAILTVCILYGIIYQYVADQPGCEME